LSGTDILDLPGRRVLERSCTHLINTTQRMCTNATMHHSCFARACRTHASNIYTTAQARIRFSVFVPCLLTLCPLSHAAGGCSPGPAPVPSACGSCGGPGPEASPAPRSRRQRAAGGDGGPSGGGGHVRGRVRASPRAALPRRARLDMRRSGSRLAFQPSCAALSERHCSAPTGRASFFCSICTAACTRRVCGALMQERPLMPRVCRAQAVSASRRSAIRWWLTFCTPTCWCGVAT
jgi:hypothetical protein